MKYFKTFMVDAAKQKSKGPTANHKLNKLYVQHEGLLTTQNNVQPSPRGRNVTVHGPLKIALEEFAPDAESYDSLRCITRFASEDFSSLSEYLFTVLKKAFEGVVRCSIYLAEEVGTRSSFKTILSHYLTINMNGNVRTSSLDKGSRISDKSDPILKAYLDKKPRFIDYRAGMDLIFKNLNYENKDCDVYVREPNILKDDVALIPFYYRERDKLRGVMVLEGNLKCKNSAKCGFGKAFYFMMAATALGAQVGFISMQKYDHTTALYKKSDFEIDLKTLIRRLLKAQKRGAQKNAIILLVDLDNFKAVNEHYGYLAGDALLSNIAKAIKNSVRRPTQNRKSDIIARWGGEEFAILLEDIDEENAIKIANRIRDEVAKAKIKVDEKEIRVTCSIGLLNIEKALATDKRTGVDEAAKNVFNKCNTLLKSVKSNGKNGIAFVSEGNGVELIRG
ncbi:MAG: GGDEF domain-containing protein [Candidatus Bilamarchaeaceae archaeon]